MPHGPRRDASFYPARRSRSGGRGMGCARVVSTRTRLEPAGGVPEPVAPGKMDGREEIILEQPPFFAEKP